MSETFFLTRHSANLIEDFARELSTGSAIFLLYGEESIGKTRLLQELKQSRLDPAKVHWLDFRENENEAPDGIDFGGQIKALDPDVENGDVIIADHFDLADSRIQHKLLKSWTIDIAYRKANMILVTGLEGLAVCRQLSQHFQVPIKSFHQLPCNRGEIEAFIALRLFPENPLSRLSIPAQLNQQIKNASGVIGRVIDIIDRDGAQIHPLEDVGPVQGSVRRRFAIVALVAIVIAVGIYLLATEYLADSIEQRAEVEMLPPANSSVDLSDNMDVGPELESQLEPQIEEPPVIVALITAAPADSLPLEVETFDEVSSDENKVENLAEAAAVVETVIDEAASDETVIDVDSINPQINQAADGDPTVERFNELLERSMKWFRLGDRSRGAIQIMSLELDKFNSRAFYDYLDKLQDSRVDLSQIRVYRTRVREVDYYCVLFGDYLNRKLATDEMGKLPDLLKRNGAIIRTFGGIQDDLARSAEG